MYSGRQIITCSRFDAGGVLSLMPAQSFAGRTSLHSPNGAPLCEPTQMTVSSEQLYIHVSPPYVSLPLAGSFSCFACLADRPIRPGINRNRMLTIARLFNTLQGHRHVEIQEPCSTAGCPSNSCFEKHVLECAKHRPSRAATCACTCSSA